MLINLLKKYHDVERIAKEMKEIDPVFIIGKGRSGTSILYKTLLRHSVFLADRLSLTESKIFDYSNRAYLFDLECNNANVRTPAFGYMFNNEKLYHDFLDSISPISRLHQFANRLIPEQLAYHLAKNTMLWKFGLNHLVVGSYFSFASKSRKSSRLLEKTPSNFWNIKKIKSVFPKSRILFIYRHPIDTYTSYIKRERIEPGKYKNLNPRRFCIEYKVELFFVRNYQKKQPNDLLLLKYEDFVTNPKRELDRVCSFIGEDFEPAILAKPEDTGTKWKADPYLFKKITSETKNWRDFLSDADGKYIENNLSALMDDLGYRKYF